MNKEEADSEDRGPGNPVHDGAIDHCRRWVSGIVQDRHFGADITRGSGSLPILEADYGLARTELHHRHESGGAVTASLVVVLERLLLIIDDHALRSDSSADQMEMFVADKIREGKKEQPREQLEYAHEMEDWSYGLAISVRRAH